MSVAVLLSVLLLGELNAQTVELVRTIDFNNPQSGKNLVTLLLGRKKQTEINPSSVCRISENLYVLTDTTHGAVYVFESTGKIRKKITNAGGVKLVSPVSVCCDTSENLYVVDSTLGGIARYDKEQNFVDVFASPQKTRITAAVFVSELFYCVDVLNHQIMVLDQQGKHIRSIGKRGTGPGEFNFPTHITANKEHLYVTDALNFRVQIFEFSGRFVRSFGTPGRGGGNFAKPKGLAVDKNGRVYVTDVMFDNIQIFDFQGKFLYYWGSPGNKEEEFWMPSGIMIDRDETIWVTDTYNSRIQIFKISEAGQ